MYLCNIFIAVKTACCLSWLYSSCVLHRQVADIADVVRQRADALMLSGESAAGMYPDKALGVLRSVATRIEEWCRQEKFGNIRLPQVGGDGVWRHGFGACRSG